MTGNDLFISATHLLQMRYPDGALPANCADLESRALPMINILLAENSFFHSIIEEKSFELKKITKLIDVLPISERICNEVLPYGLASLLIVDENTNLSSYLRGIYLTSKTALQKTLSTKSTDIVEVY